MGRSYKMVKMSLTAFGILAILTITTMATSDESSLIKEEGITADMTPQVCLAKTSGEALKMTDEECLASRSLGESSGMESVVKAVERATKTAENAAKSALSPYKY